MQIIYYLALNQNNVSEWSDMSVYPHTVVSVGRHYLNPTQRVGVGQSGYRHHHQTVTCSRHNMAEKLLSWR